MDITRLFKGQYAKNVDTKRENNRKSSNSRRVILVPKYTKEKIEAARTTIERERRARCFKNIHIYR